MSGKRLQIYCFLVQKLLFFFKRPSVCLPYGIAHKKVIWFHAASAGELESLIPVILLFSQKAALVISVFSPSGLKNLSFLEKKLKSMNAELVYSGLSPVEGSWKSFFENLEVQCFVTAKYEAWPEVWAWCALKKIPLVIISAAPRLAYSIAKKMSFFLTSKYPALHLTCLSEDQESLEKALFAQTHVVFDPRWKQVHQRLSQEHARVKVLQDCFDSCGILGNIWMSDLIRLEKIPKDVFVVPHCIKLNNVKKIHHWLSQRHQVLLSSQIVASEDCRGKIILVDEMGFLAELYAIADWAYVGGGFEKGVHSTIEPAVAGLPICCGLKRANKFSEISFLKKRNQLLFVKNALEFTLWLKNKKSFEFYLDPAFIQSDEIIRQLILNLI